jgi:cell wall-associated NlpC family hydrolase
MIMRWTAIIFISAAVIIGCQGQPRYGGGLHTAEGQHKPAVKEESPPQPGPAPASAVDPLAMGRIIDRYLGKPYAGKGETQKGYDCSEFVCAVYEEYASIHLPRTTENMFKAGRPVKAGDLMFGDLVFFDTGGRGVSHVGIYVGFDEFVHASTSNGIIISNLNEDYYRKRYIGSRRVME